MKTCLRLLLVITGASILTSCGQQGGTGSGQDTTALPEITPDADTAGLKLPAGFGAIKVADSIGKARHLVVTSEGDIYVKLASVKDGKGIIRLHDADGDGRAEEQSGFGDYGGTGIALKNGYLYASSNTDVYRYKLNEHNQVAASAQPEKIVTGLIDRNQHESKSIVLDNDGNIYVNIGAFSNACQQQDRTAGSPGMQPCPVLDSAGGIWQFKADQQDQTYGNGVRYATGLRNVVGLDWNQQTNALYVMQHGRDQLHDMFPKKFTQEQSINLPAECLYRIDKGADAGWPYIYYDGGQQKKILAPEYGGDGKKTGGENAIDPLVAFPAHMAPNGLLFYTGDMFPEKYKNGAFIAFHGSWNRAPEKQEGYYVAFVPFKDGKPSGNWEVFADGFAGTDNIVSPGDAKHRPCGLAQGPDGSLYVSDDARGTIYRIVYKK
ncbi:PQQ-dependent sugar dehydrogenase [Chitinophaga japonensis]|uniref:Glucose/arabinose dehydrogenase n=1 Tax=Chitinophaga japonensis TaxID=104662 RepID=A0A562SMC1_CHIJA|nr:PQQ-dependent sugar dehydrogenase [Chitinophaga japonensis]TWI82471.1 glucose/arabinose dehydrogenase [Chitinophaga japonensis]